MQSSCKISKKEKYWSADQMMKYVLKNDISGTLILAVEIMLVKPFMYSSPESAHISYRSYVQ